MQIPIQGYFRVLVVGGDQAPVAKTIEEELGFRVECADSDLVKERKGRKRRSSPTGL